MTSLRGKVVVITGASSGLGREAAIQFAAHGCTLVLAARRAQSLDETAHLCREAGGTAMSIVTDVTREADVMRLAGKAVEAFEHIDIWINNAGVTLFGLLEGAPFEAHRRVIETNLYGAIFGARAVIPIFRRQERGVLINVGSILSKIGQPFVPSYVISKFALRGLSEALRADMANVADVHVCSIFPYAMSTQHFESGANYVGQKAHAMSPAQSPEKVARAIVKLAQRPRRERHVPRIAVFGLALHVLMPRTVERLLLRVLSEWHFSSSPEPQNQGNLFQPPKSAAHVYGERPPQISAPGLFAWIVRQMTHLRSRTPKKPKPTKQLRTPEEAPSSSA